MIVLLSFLGRSYYMPYLFVIVIFVTNFKGNDLTLNLILILKHQQEHNNPINLEILNLVKKSLCETQNNSVKCHAFLAEILYFINEIELANKQNELALNIWLNDSMEFDDLMLIVVMII